MMDDDLFFKVMQLSTQEKLELVKAIEDDLLYKGEGSSFLGISVLKSDKFEIIKRHEDLSRGAMCLIEFDDHVIHLQKSGNE